MSKLIMNQEKMVVAHSPNPNEITQNGYNKGYISKSITETIINGFFTVDRNWTVKYWSPAAEKLLGITAKQIVGKNI